MTHDPERHRIEEQVIGQCLDGGHIICLDILSPTSFSVELHRRIFTVISDMSDALVDIITVSRAYTSRYKDLKAYEITVIADRFLHRGANFYPLLLLEIDIREKFIGLLDGYREASAAESDFESAAIWKQCVDHMAHRETDIFDSIPQIYEFLRQYKPEETEEYKSLMSALPKKLDSIRKVRHFNQLLTNLKLTNSFYGQRGDLMNIASDILIQLSISAKIHPDLESYLYHIKNELL